MRIQLALPAPVRVCVDLDDQAKRGTGSGIDGGCVGHVVLRVGALARISARRLLNNAFGFGRGSH